METRAQQVVKQLRERLLSGTVAAGTHLEEVPLAEQLQVSRTPVRQALALLAQEGLLEYMPKRGYVVRSFGLEDIAATYEVRATLEGLACRMVAEQGIDADVTQRLTDCVRIGDRILAKGRLDAADFQVYRDMNVRFHETILSAAGNRLLGNFVQQAYNLPLTSDRVMFWTDFKVIERSHDDHRRLVEAFAECCGWRAEALMREHIYASGRFVTDQYVSGRLPVASVESTTPPAARPTTISEETYP